MNVKIQSIHFDAGQKLIQFNNTKVNKLQTFNHEIIDSQVYLRLDKSDSTENKISEIKLSVPGNDLFAKKQCKTFEEATDQCIDALRRQLKKKKEKALP